MVVLVLFVAEPNFWIILAIVTIIAASQFTKLEFIHPVRTKRWRKVSLPVAFLWTFFAGLSAWHDFDPGPVTIAALSLTSAYLLVVGIAMQIIPARKA